MGRRSLSVEPEKVHRLTLAELAAHDDACSDAMVDNAYFKSQIRKNKTKYFPLRIKEDEIPQILLHKVIVAKDPVAAEKDILRVSGLKKYRSTLKSRAEQDNFLKHLRKYIYMYQTDCPWEVSTTNRYTITTYEAAVTARQRIKHGQIIKYLTGTLVPLTIQESADLDHTNRNFSIVVSSRKKNSSIFLGPARFANHDCGANGRLVTRGSDAMEVIAMKNIEVGDEITVSYGDDYFGPDNADCLCHTCERLVRNGWAPAGENGSDYSRNSQQPSQEPASPGLASRKRKREASINRQDTPVLPSPKKSKTMLSPSKLQQSWTPTSTEGLDTDMPSQSIPPAEETERDRGEELPMTNTDRSPPESEPENLTDMRRLESDAEDLIQPPVPRQDPQIQRNSSEEESSTKEPMASEIAMRLLTNLSTDKQYPLSPASTINSSNENIGIAASFTDSAQSGDQVFIKIESVETSTVESDTIVVNEQRESSPVRRTHPKQKPAAVSTLKTTEISRTRISASGDGGKILPSIESSVMNTTIATSSQLSVKPVFEKNRVPGDYILTRKLLAQPHDRWVQCHNEKCLGFFIQPNGYQTRRECPRCERHSILYGFSWPKTDPDLRKITERSPSSKKGKSKVERSAFRRAGRCGKGIWYEGGGDEEERVMDHRIVHRFVLPEDEKSTTRRGLLKEAEIVRSFKTEFDPSEIYGSGRKRTDSVGMGVIDSANERGSLTPDGEIRRRSNRFVTRVGVYADN